MVRARTVVLLVNTLILSPLRALTALDLV